MVSTDSTNTTDKNDSYVIEQLKSAIWSGFYSDEEVLELASDLLEAEDDDTPEEEIEAFVESEFERKRAEEATWPEETDCDRLSRAFAALNERGIIALENAGYTLSEGHADIAEARRNAKGKEYRGYCFYHGQDLERVVESGVLNLAFGDFDDTREGARAVGTTVVEGLKQQGFQPEWDEDPKRRIEIAKLDWKRRLR